MTTIGDRPHRVAFQSQSGSTQNSYHEEIPVWATYFTAWAKVEQTGGSETELGQRLTGTKGVRITLPWSSEVNSLSEQHRAKWSVSGSTRVAQITSVNHDQDRKRLVIVDAAITST